MNKTVRDGKTIISVVGTWHVFLYGVLQRFGIYGGVVEHTSVYAYKSYYESIMLLVKTKMRISVSVHLKANTRPSYIWKIIQNDV